MSNPDTSAPAPQTDAAPAEQPAKKRKLPRKETVVKYAKYALMGVGAVTIAKTARDLSQKQVSVDVDVEVNDRNEAPESD